MVESTAKEVAVATTHMRGRGLGGAKSRQLEWMMMHWPPNLSLVSPYLQILEGNNG
jgi:hypothetical protein